MLGIHVDLKPVLVQEYSESCELIVAEVEIGNTRVRVMTGYGPQESWDENERTPFFEALESEIARAELESRSVIISMDANSKLCSLLRVFWPLAPFPPCFAPYLSQKPFFL